MSINKKKPLKKTTTSQPSPKAPAKRKRSELATAVASLRSLLSELEGARAGINSDTEDMLVAQGQLNQSVRELAKSQRKNFSAVDTAVMEQAKAELRLEQIEREAAQIRLSLAASPASRFAGELTEWGCTVGKARLLAQKQPAVDTAVQAARKALAEYRGKVQGLFWLLARHSNNKQLRILASQVAVSYERLDDIQLSAYD
jgi:hypothetical protein